MDNWTDRLNNQSFFYITPDIKRGLGPESILRNYHVICSFKDPIIPILRKQKANILCLAEIENDQADNLVNSGKLLENTFVIDYIKKKSIGKPNILLFKPSIKAELLCRDKDYNLLVNNSVLNRQYENKISFHNLVNKYFPGNSIPSLTGSLSDFNLIDLAKRFELPFIIQFSLGWAGKTTFMINQEEDFKKLLSRFPLTPVKISKYIAGFTVLNNACIYKRKVFVSPPAFQISGFSELSSNPFSTCGREWPAKFLTAEMEKTIYDLTLKIGEIMIKNGYKGLFGLDFIIDERNGKVILSENNARFTASTAFWTKMEIGENLTPLMAYHLAEFLGIELNSDYVVDNDISATQLIFRDANFQPKKLETDGFGVFSRIQNTWKLEQPEYRPENLGHDEIIYMKREKVIKGDSELSRIETKVEAVKSVKSLHEWVKKLL